MKKNVDEKNFERKNKRLKNIDHSVSFEFFN